MGGKFSLKGDLYFASGLSATASSMWWHLNGTTVIRGSEIGAVVSAGGGINQYVVTCDVALAAADYVELRFYNGAGGTVVIGHASSLDGVSTASIALIGV